MASSMFGIRYSMFESSNVAHFFYDSIQVLVAATGYVNQNNFILPHPGRALDSFRHGVRGLQGRDDAFGVTQPPKRVQGFLIRGGCIKGSLVIPHLGVLGSDR